VGIAATVAIVAVGTLRSLNEASVAPGNPAASMAVMPLQARDARADLAPSYVVPQDTDPSRTASAPRLTNYLMHHGEFASGLTRTSVNSNVVGAAMEPVVTETAVSKPVIQEGLE
jgi:hypothetical protein